MKKKWIVVLLICLAVAVLAGLIIWQHTKAVDILPEEAWAGQHQLMRSDGIPDSGSKIEEVSGAKLREAFSGAWLWRIPNRNGYPGGEHIFLHIELDGCEYALYAGENGYILLTEIEENWSGKETKHAWYRDDGSLYQALLETMSSDE